MKAKCIAKERRREMKLFVKPLTFLFALVAALAMVSGLANAQQKPNILVIWGDDIGIWNISTTIAG
jgi:arylsulfatase